jgi:hypothetical protein
MQRKFSQVLPKPQKSSVLPACRGKIQERTASDNSQAKKTAATSPVFPDAKSAPGDVGIQLQFAMNRYHLIVAFFGIVMTAGRTFLLAD